MKEHVTDKWTVDIDFQDITDRLVGIASMGRSRRATIPGTPTTEYDLDSAIQSAIDNDAERQRLQYMKLRNRNLARREKQRSRSQHVLRHLSAGGWGKKAMGKEMQNMRRLRIDDTTAATDNRKFREAAAMYDSGSSRTSAGHIKGTPCAVDRGTSGSTTTSR